MVKRLFFIRRSSLRLLLLIVAFLFSAIAGISVAAWLDAPNAPPNYGLTPPFTQNDFKPMNLGTTPQTKRGSVVVVGTLIATSTTPTSFPNFPGNVVASGFYDSEDTSYFLDPASMGGYSGVFSSSIGIRQHSPNASLSVNNYYDILDPLHPKETLGKVGSSGDAIYAYTNSTGAAISAEQGNPTGYAVYASGGINFFGGDVKVGSATSPKSLCINDDCKAAWPSGVWTQTGNDIYNNNTGNVGIGATMPGAKLDVDGTVRSLSGGFMFPDGTTQTTAFDKSNLSIINCHDSSGSGAAYGVGWPALASCPSGKDLIFYAEMGHGEHNTDWNNTQVCKTSVDKSPGGQLRCFATAGAPGCSTIGIGLCL